LNQCLDCGLDVYREIMPKSDNFSQFGGYILKLIPGSFLRFFVSWFVSAFLVTA
jgi:hypothetical protein